MAREQQERYKLELGILYASDPERAKKVEAANKFLMEAMGRKYHSPMEKPPRQRCDGRCMYCPKWDRCR